MGLNCPICLEDVQAEEAVTGIPCGHLFHTACIDLYRTSLRDSASTCPQCRTPYTNSMRLYPNIENDSNVDVLMKTLKEKAELQDDLKSLQEEFSNFMEMNDDLRSHIAKLDDIILSQTQKISKLEEENMILKNPVPINPITLELERTKQLKDLFDSDKSELIKLDAVLDRIVIITGMSRRDLQMTTLEFLSSVANAAQWDYDDNDIEATYRRGWNLQKKELIVLLKTIDVKRRMVKMLSLLKHKPNWKFIKISNGYKHNVWELWNYANCLLEHGCTKVYIYSAEVFAYYGNRDITILNHAHVDRLKAAAELNTYTMNSNTTEVQSAAENGKNAGEWHLKGIAPKEIAAKRNENIRNAARRIAAKEHKESTTTTERKQSRTATEPKESTTASEPK